MAANGNRIDFDEFVAEYRWTWVRHLGDITLAAPIFGLKPSSMEKRLWRAKQMGYDVTYVNTSKRVAS